MSLTRAEWNDLWNATKRIENNANIMRNFNKIRAQMILNEVEFIKIQIQKVIGQME